MGCLRAEHLMVKQSSQRKRITNKTTQGPACLNLGSLQLVWIYKTISNLSLQKNPHWVSCQSSFKNLQLPKPKPDSSVIRFRVLADVLQSLIGPFLRPLLASSEFDAVSALYQLPETNIAYFSMMPCLQQAVELNRMILRENQEIAHCYG